MREESLTSGTVSMLAKMADFTIWVRVSKGINFLSVSSRISEWRRGELVEVAASFWKK